jgi:hypothetical protein
MNRYRSAPDTKGKTMKAGRLSGYTAAALAATLVAGCAGNGGGTGGVMGTDTGKGALFGGATGALIGGLIDHADPAVGLLIGAPATRRCSCSRTTRCSST